MQLNDLQKLVSKLKQNRDMQVETTTLGRFLGANSAKVAMVLGREMLNRPIIVSTREDQIQLLDLKTGFVVSLNSADDILPKLVRTFSNEETERPKMTASEGDRIIHTEATERRTNESPISHELCECRDVMYGPGSLADKLEMVKKTIQVLEGHKTACENGELERVEKAQEKLQKLIEHANTHRLAPGQVPSVYEIAIWSWVN